jgi:hypothetical protein
LKRRPGSADSGTGGPSRGRWVFSAFLTAVVVTAIAVVVGNERRSTLDGIGAHERTTTGVVTSARRIFRAGLTTYSVDYEYWVNGAYYKGVKGVDRDTALAVRHGTPIAVTYDASAPSHSIAATSVAAAKNQAKFGGWVVWVLVAGVWLYAFSTLGSLRSGGGE